MKKPYDLNAAREGSIVSVMWNNTYQTYEKKEDGWHLNGIPIVVMTPVLRVGEQAFYRAKGAPIKTGLIQQILPRT